MSASAKFLGKILFKSSITVAISAKENSMRVVLIAVSVEPLNLTAMAIGINRAGVLSRKIASFACSE